MLAVFASCEQPTMLSVSQTALSFENSGGNQSVTLTANKVWTASSNQGWLRVSPSSGEGNATLSISCEGNTTYDGRTGNITIVSEELTQTISVTQAEGLGLLISQSEYNLSNEAQTIDVTVQANVLYTVEINNACRDWIKQESTKGLSSNTIKFAISKNESYDGREGKINIKQTIGSLSATVVVKQSQTNALFADTTEYKVSFEEQQLDIKVKSNIDFEVIIDDSCKNWLSRIQTKGLVEETLSFQVAKNEGETRTGKVLLKNEWLQETITIKQEADGYVEFADKNFKSYCIANFDKNGDGEISFSEALSVMQVKCSIMSISSLAGIEYFKKITSLSCYNNQLTSLDVSKNTALKELWCDGNQLISLDVSKNTALTHLYCFDNRLTSLDVSKNTALTDLECDSNQLTYLDVSKNTTLTELSCGHNQLTSLDVSKNTALTGLYCDRNQLTSLDVSKNTALTFLRCELNQLSNLDVSRNTKLTRLYCDNNQLKSLDVSMNSALTHLSCRINQLTSLDVSTNTALTSLDCKDNQLTSLAVSGCTALTHLYCVHNKLTSLNVTTNTALTGLYCGGNLLTSIDVSKNIALTYLHCEGNQLTSLDVSKNIALTELWCHSNPYLTEIWLKTGQTIPNFVYDTDVAIVKYK